MFNKFIISTALVIAGSTGAFAQGFSGSVGYEYSDFNDIDGAEKGTFSGSAEYAISPQFAVALDFAIYDYQDAPSDVDFNNITMHGIYSLNSDVKLGLWFGRDSISFGSDDFKIDNYGVEAAYSAGPVGFQGYLGAGDAEGQDLTYFGASTDYGFGNGFSVIASYDLVDVSDADFSLSTIEVGGAYALSSGASFYATLGNLSLDAGGSTEDENFFTIGAKFDFGENGGTTFKQPGYLSLPLLF